MLLVKDVVRRAPDISAEQTKASGAPARPRGMPAAASALSFPECPPEQAARFPQGFSEASAACSGDAAIAPLSQQPLPHPPLSPNASSAIRPTAACVPPLTDPVPPCSLQGHAVGTELVLLQAAEMFRTSTGRGLHVMCHA